MTTNPVHYFDWEDQQSREADAEASELRRQEAALQFGLAEKLRLLRKQKHALDSARSAGASDHSPVNMVRQDGVGGTKPTRKAKG